MTYEEARRRILHHAAATEDALAADTPVGFLEMLRPYKGIREDVLADVVASLKAIADVLRGAKTLDRELVSALWGICHFGRAWALAPDGMLRRNHLISAEDVERLESWLDSVSYAIAMLLDGADDATAFEELEA